MKNIIFGLFLILNLGVFAQEKFTISGNLNDASNGEGLIGASIKVADQAKGTITNVYGFYSLTLPKGQYKIVYSYLGYQTVTKDVNLDKNIKFNIELKEKSTTINEVVITGEASNKNVESLDMSKDELNIEQIKGIPALMGEVDVIKAIQLLPGVQTIGEGGSGFFVRGGAADQNLILLDEANVYNASHLMGFFSVFNPDAVKNVELYKGGIPAQYGGRLASVLDIRMKDGNMKKFSGQGGIGTISSRLTLTAPIKKDKGAIMLSGRRTYADLFLPLANNPDLDGTKLYFYDANVKGNYSLNDNNRLFLSGYFGRDVLSINNQFNMDWGNATGTLRWNHVFNDKLFLNSTAVFSSYNYELGTPTTDDDFNFTWKSRINDYYLKEDFNYYLDPKNTVKFGLQSAFHQISPGTISFKNEGIENEIVTPTTNSLEHAIYVSNEQQFNNRFSAIYGLRYSLFQNIGTATVYGYDENYEVKDTTTYAKGDIYQTYGGLEPRLGLKYTLDETSSVKASYNRTRQYIQLASNSTSSSPLDVWFSSSPNVKPQYADQVALGYFKNIKNNMIETSAEVYYKKMYNTIDFKDHAQLIFNQGLEGELRIGEAHSYGLELMAKKTKGKWTGWLSYTFSRVFKDIELINEGNPYPAKYDQPHNISFVTSYEFSKRFMLSLNWVYNTGRAVSMPTGKFVYQGQTIPIYSAKNSERLPAYHRMDISATLKSKNYDTKKFKGEWVFSIYNLYNRANAYSLNFVENKDTGATEAQMLYLFKVIPSITYNFKF